uniref:U3 small nucleolar RNA-associated protein 22 n=1 Tax=Arcella intermedia TaxID=1963864 RepID=A0A6B2KWR6_9EUKA
MQSNLFALQLEEMLREVSVNYNQTRSIEVSIEALNQILSKMPPGRVTPQTFSDLKFFKFYSGEGERVLDFKPPTSVMVVGSFLLKTQAKPLLNIDMAIEIPSSTFKDRDKKDFVYYDKRNMYLAHIAQHLQNTQQFKDVSVSNFRGDPLKPHLKIRPIIEKSKAEQMKSRFVINLYPTIKQHIFSPSKHLLPGKVNYSVDKFPPVPELKNLAAGDYNNGITEDMFYDRHLQTIHKICALNSSFRDAIIIFKVWLRQRDMTTSKRSSFNGFLMSMFMVHLYHSKIIDNAMAPYHIVRITLNHLINTNIENGIFMKPEKPSEGNEVEMKYDLALDDAMKGEYLKAFPVVFVDPSGRVNLTSRMSRRCWGDLIYEAKRAKNILESPNIDATAMEAFQAVFLVPVQFGLKYDGYIRILPTKSGVEDTNIPEVVSLLEKGLGNRMSLIQEYQPDVPVLKLTENQPNPNLSTTIIGLLFSPENWKRLVDTGPSADNTTDSIQFKKFWGSKAEVRRFRDGLILYCVVWKAKGIELRHHIISQISKYLIKVHYPNLLERVVIDLGEEHLDHLAVPVPSEYSSSEMADYSASSSHSIIIAHFEQLAKIIKNLKGIPLEISAVHAVSPIYKFTDPCPPKPHPLLNQHHNGPVEKDLHFWAFDGTIQFLKSGGWPDQLEAIQNIKTALYIAMGNSLLKSHNIQNNPTRKYLDVFYSGFVFRFKIFHPPEIIRKVQTTLDFQLTETFYMQLLDAKGEDLSNMAIFSNNAKLPEFSEEVMKLPEHRDLVSRKQLAGYLHALHLKYPAFGPTTRLVARWLERHMLLGHFWYEAVELIVAGVFCGGMGAYEVPSHYVCAFYRVLQLLATHDWAKEPLVVDFNKDFTSEAYSTIKEKYESIPENKKPALFISYISDKFSSLWTKEKPNHLVFHRVVQIAKMSFQKLRESVYPIEKWASGIGEQNRGPVVYQSLFGISLNDYDVLVWLDPNLLPRFNIEALSTKVGGNPPHRHLKKNNSMQVYKNVSNDLRNMMMVNFDPMEKFVEDLEKRLKNIALIFFDPEADVVGIMFQPPEFLINKFLPQRSINTLPVKDPKKNDYVGIIPNIFSILNDIQSIGKGIINKIEIVKGSYKL